MGQYKNPQNKTLATWIKQAPQDVLDAFADYAKTSPATYRQWISGRRKLSPEKAAVVEAAMVDLEIAFSDSPIALTRGDLCLVCKQCPHFIKSTEKETLIE